MNLPYKLFDDINVHLPHITKNLHWDERKYIKIMGKNSVVCLKAGKVLWGYHNRNGFWFFGGEADMDPCEDISSFVTNKQNTYVICKQQWNKYKKRGYYKAIEKSQKIPKRENHTGHILFDYKIRKKQQKDNPKISIHILV